MAEETYGTIKSSKYQNDASKPSTSFNDEEDIKTDGKKKEDRSITHSLIHVEPFEKDTLSIADFFTSKYDYVVKRNMYMKHGKTLSVYDLFRLILVDKERNIKTPIITLSPDPSISASTLSGAAEKYMYTDINPKTGNMLFKTDLKVIYIDSSPDLSTNKYTSYDDFRKAVLSSITGVNSESYSMHKVNIPLDSITLLGIDDDNMDEDQSNIVNENNMNMFSLKIMKKKGIDKIMNKIIDELENEPVHVVIDLSCMMQEYAPSVIRDGDKNKGFTFNEMQTIIESFKRLKKLNGVDITGYNFGLIADKDKHYLSNMITVKTIEMITCSIIELKEKSINIFNEDSKFLIWRRCDDYDSYGWYILRNISLPEREELIRSIPEDVIIPINIPSDNGNDSINDDDNDDNSDDDEKGEEEDEGYVALVTVTTIREQQEKSYYTAKSIDECCLYPGEKLSMIFELLNTPQTQIQNSPNYSDTNTDDVPNIQMQIIE